MSQQRSLLDEQPEIKNTFDIVVKECTRSITKETLHASAGKEKILATQLNTVIKKYDEDIVGQFKAIYKEKNPELLFLIMQVIGAVFEKTFHDGSCGGQASYGLIELTKKRIFNSSLAWNRTGDKLTEHFYLVILDENTLKTIKTIPQSEDPFIRVKTTNLSSQASKLIYFDTWSKQLCEYKKFQPDNKYTKLILTTDQAVFRPFIHLFKNEIDIFEKIIWCLNEYEKRLKDLPKEDASKNIIFVSTNQDLEYENEVKSLNNHDECIAKLLSTIESYKKEFQKQLELVKQPSAKTVGDSIAKAMNTSPSVKYTAQLQKVMNCFMHPEDKTPMTPEIALRRVAGGEQPKGNTGLPKNINIVEYFLQNGANINDPSPTTGRTALHNAVINGQIESVKILRAANANIDHEDTKEKKSAKMYALESLNNEIKALFTNVASVNSM